MAVPTNIDTAAIDMELQQTKAHLYALQQRMMQAQFEQLSGEVLVCSLVNGSKFGLDTGQIELVAQSMQLRESSLDESALGAFELNDRLIQVFDPEYDIWRTTAGTYEFWLLYRL